MDHLRRLYYRLGSSFWFLPAVIVAGAVVLAFVAIEADARYVTAGALEAWPRMFGAGASASRSLLSAVAGSMITVAGTVFSITLVALSLASSQYSSRVLRNFIRDRTNQSVLGVFVGIFAYCLVVLRSIHGSDDAAFVPSVAVFLGLLLGFGGIGVLVFFIHHIALAIQASQILDAIRTETTEAIDRLFPRTARDAGDGTPPDGGPWHEARRAARTGYLQYVNHAGLRDVAHRHGVRLAVHPRIGDFVVEGERMLSASPSTPDGLGDEVANCWTIGAQRTLEQDVGFGIRQLVDVALKALSPGINDTTTAIMCVDTLTALLARLAPRELVFDGCGQDGAVLVHARHPRFADLLDEAFDQVRHAGADNVAVLDRLRWSLALLWSRTGDARRAELARHARRLREAVERTLRDPHDRARLSVDVDMLLREMGEAGRDDATPARG